MPKQARLSGIKSFRCYTPEEAASITGVSPRTISNWEADGLRVMDSSRPALIRGDDLRSFIKAQRVGRKVKTGIDEFYCCRCRKAQKAAGGFADCVIIGKRVTLTALCIKCETVVTKLVAKTRISEIAQAIDLTITRQEVTL